MRYAALIGLCIILAASVHAIETTSARPTINITADEFSVMHNATLKTGSIPLASIAESPLGSTYSLGSGSALSFFVKPLRWMDNGAYELFVSVSDLLGNKRDATWQFSVNSTGQRITLVDPQFGGTNDLYADVRIQSELPSVCRWSTEKLFEADLRQLTTFKRMQAFNATYDNPREFHDITDFFFIANTSKQHNVPVTLSVTCDDGTRLTPRQFTITYLNASQPPKLQSVKNAPDPVVDYNNPSTTITVVADQEVWCTGGGEKIFGNETYDNYRTPQTGVYVDTNYEEKPELKILCYNRAGNFTSVLHTIHYNYTSPLNITVHSLDTALETTYVLNFTTNKIANCSVLNNGAATSALNPQTRASRFISEPFTLREGKNTLTITCTAPYADPATKLHAVIVDTAPPTLHSIFVPPASCGENKIVARFNASDGANGSGIALYNYSVQTTQGRLAVQWKTTTSAEVSIPVRLNASEQYIVVGKAYDRAGRASQEVKSGPMKVTDATDTACDTERPETHIFRTTNTTVMITCRDNLACTDTFYIETVNVSAKCTLNATNLAGTKEKQYTRTNSTKDRLSDEITIGVGDTVCWSVADTAGNRVFDVRTFNQLPRPPNDNKTNQTPTNTCSNGIKDGVESDIDCGGAICTAQGKLCNENKTCYSALDCSSSNCASNKCAQATCTDGFRNGNETGRDCGGNCAACATGEQCTANYDCAGGKICDRGVCTSLDAPTNREESTPPDAGEEPLPTQSNFLSLLLILLGVTSILGGSAYIVLYEPKKEQRTAPMREPIATFERPLDVPVAKTEAKKTVQKRKLHGKERVENLMEEFDAQALTEKEEVTHTDIEQAYNNLDKDEFTKLTKTLLADNKVQHKDIEIALADAEEDDSVIEELRKEFKIRKRKE